MKNRIGSGEQWNRWATAWRGDHHLDEAARSPRRRQEILRMVRRQTALTAAGAVAQLAIAAAFTIFGILLVRGDAGLLEWVTALATWTFVAIAVGAAATGERRLWRPRGETTRDFVRLCDRRLNNRLRSLRWGLYLLAIEVVFFVPWIWWAVRSKPPATVTWHTWAGAYGLLALLVGVFSISIAILLRRTRERLHRLEAFSCEIEDV